MHALNSIHERDKGNNVLVLTGLILLNLILKIVFLNVLPLGGDEPFTVFFSQASISEMFEMLKIENNPPFHFILMKFWSQIFGISTTAARIPSLLFSLGTVALIYKIGARYFSVLTGITASFLFSFSSLHFLFSHEARVYSAFGFFTVASMYFFLKILYQEDSRKDVVMLVLLNTGLLYAHFFGFFVLFIQLLFLILFEWRNKKLCIRFLVLFGIVGALYLPYFPILIDRFLFSSAQGWVEPPKNAGALYFMLWKFCNAPLSTILLLLVLVAAGIVYLAQQKDQLVSKASKLILLWALVPFLLMFALSFKVPMFLDRYVSFCSFGFYLAAAAGISFLFSASVYRIVASGVLTLGFIVTFRPNLEHQLRKADQCVARVIQLKQERPGTLVVISPYWAFRTFAYYYNLDYFKNYTQTVLFLNRENVYPIYNVGEVPKELLEKSSDIIFIDNWAGVADPGQSMDQYLSSKGNLKKEEFGDMTLKVWTK
jgi:mannosyltransferase